MKKNDNLDLASPLLKIKDLHITFNTPKGVKEVVSGVDFFIDRGETLALVGESGSGKTITAMSILQLLGGNAKMTQGDITFNHQRLDTLSRQEMQKIRGKEISMIFQDPMTSLNPTIKIGKQIAEAAIWHEGISKEAAKTRTIELLKKVGINDPETRFESYPHELSGGMRQRVMIAMALICNPKLLIADEPTTALDVTIQAQILELLRQITKETKMSLLLITHDLGVVSSIACRVAVMQNGKIVETSSTHNLFKKPQHPYTKTLLNAVSG